MMRVQITCEKCGSSIEVHPDVSASHVHCDVCQHSQAVSFTQEHLQGQLKSCPVCQRQDFYQQKDFNRKIGVGLFILASIAAIWTYGLSFIVLYALDFFLFKKLGSVAICYKCATVFRGVQNLSDIPQFDHEMHDRILYNNEDFKGKPLQHH